MAMLVGVTKPPDELRTAPSSYGTISAVAVETSSSNVSTSVVGVVSGSAVRGWVPRSASRRG